MPFAINAAGPSGAFAFPPESAQDAFGRVLRLEAEGFKNIVIKDERGRIVSREQLEALSRPQPG
jgi:hypothetical protein